MKNKTKIKLYNVVDEAAFDVRVFEIMPPDFDDQGNICVECRSTLGDRSTFDIVWFRLMGQWLIDDMYIVGDGDDGIVVYRFHVVAK